MAQLAVESRRTRRSAPADDDFGLSFTGTPSVSDVIEPGGDIIVQGNVEYVTAIGGTIEYQVRTVDVDTGDTWDTAIKEIDNGTSEGFKYSFPSGLSAGQSRQVEVVARGRAIDGNQWFEGEREGPFTVTAEEGGGGGGGGNGGTIGGNPVTLLQRTDVQLALLGGLGGYYYATRTGEYRPRTAALAGAAGGVVAHRLFIS